LGFEEVYLKKEYIKVRANAKKALIFTGLLFIVVLSLGAVIDPVAAETNELVEGTTDATVEFTDFNNGTTLMVKDYRNGTKDVISETIQMRTAKLQLGKNVTNQTLCLDLPTSTEESTEWITATEDVVIEQEVLMGFTYQLTAQRWVGIDVLFAYARAGVDVDIGFGLRLPVRIALEYPEQMTVGHDYELYATLTPLDRPDYNEFLCKFKAKVWVEAGVWFFGWKEYSASLGLDYDWSRSFPTPIGPAMEFPIPSFEILVFDSAWVIGFSVLKLNLVIDPQLGSDKITAKAKAGGDAAGEHIITWSAPDQKIPFTVHANDYGPTDFAEIELSDFRYYFSIFKLHFGLKFDFHRWIDWLIGDPTIGLFTLDMSWLTEGLYLGVHAGTDGTVEVSVVVERAGYVSGVIDEVDIGNPRSERGHSLWGWGPIEPKTHGGGWKGNYRVTWHPHERTSYSDRAGMVTLYRREYSVIKYLCLRVLDGIADDSFNVYVKVSWGKSWTKWKKVYDYDDSDPSRHKSCWVQHRIRMPERWRFAKKVRVAIVAKGKQWSGFETHGQLAVDWIGIAGCIKVG